MNISNAKQVDKEYQFFFSTKNNSLHRVTEKHQEKDQNILPVIGSLQTLLQCFLDNIGSKVEEVLLNNVNNLQDCFLELLYEKLEGIDTQYKITLCLDPLQSLILAHEHPQEQEILERIRENEKLSYIFSQISLHASALRSMRHLKYIAVTGEVEATDPIYYINLKGDMNHFYFY